MKTKFTSIFAVAGMAFASSALAAPVDLSAWSALTLNFPGAQPAGNWVVNGTNTAVEQTVNADPSFFLNNLNQTSYSIDGSWRVKTSSDNDFMGFVFGYQNSSNFYLFDWKQGAQNEYTGVANEGMSIKKYEGATGDGLTDLSLGEFWENTSDKGSMTVLDTNFGGTAGWVNNRLYNFHLDFNTVANQFSIKITDTVTTNTLWDTTIVDSTFTSGQFGFYNFSQSNVEYAGFTQDGGIIVDDPIATPDSGSTALLLLAGLLGMAAIKRKLY